MHIPDLKRADLKLLLQSVKYKGGIVTGGECGAGCKYCYLRESKRASWYIPLNIPFISKNDFKKAVSAAKKYKHTIVSLGDGVDLISSEPFSHPLIYEFIEEIEKTDFIVRLNYRLRWCLVISSTYAALRRVELPRLILLIPVLLALRQQ